MSQLQLIFPRIYSSQSRKIFDNLRLMGFSQAYHQLEAGKITNKTCEEMPAPWVPGAHFSKWLRILNVNIREEGKRWHSFDFLLGRWKALLTPGFPLSSDQRGSLVKRQEQIRKFQMCFETFLPRVLWGNDDNFLGREEGFKNIPAEEGRVFFSLGMLRWWDLHLSFSEQAATEHVLTQGQTEAIFVVMI